MGYEDELQVEALDVELGGSEEDATQSLSTAIVTLCEKFRLLGVPVRILADASLNAALTIMLNVASKGMTEPVSEGIVDAAMRDLHEQMADAIKQVNTMIEAEAKDNQPN